MPKRDLEAAKTNEFVVEKMLNNTAALTMEGRYGMFKRFMAGRVSSIQADIQKLETYK
jgi:hypothetical protein